ncbi:hypothetical protein CRENPOLYSF2_2430004 [Crenothrix polyspora]|uniref:Uncharacterized protein n=1 Tax=Crenothrix polyspora TaxID=360316 RepID=A0A1R4H6P1_9GAMM|nr:hypothetical protein [Crenothrix polyspora]SJM91923.1 hypothetical protein CRENPOLYSF2_2430004 [Crenothrix polyspora]
MSVTVILHNETSITHIANRLYANLTAESRKIAETALLRLNPVLSDSNGVKPGVIIKLPEIPSLILNDKHINDDPTAQAKEVIKNAIKTYGDQLQGRIKTQQDDLHSQENILNEVEKEISELPDLNILHKRIKTLKKSVATRIDDTKTYSDNLNTMFAQIFTDLSK